MSDDVRLPDGVSLWDRVCVVVSVVVPLELDDGVCVRDPEVVRLGDCDCELVCDCDGVRAWLLDDVPLAVVV